MQLAVFGSTGFAGEAFTQLALENGHQVRALVRDPRAAGRAVSRVEVVQGDALDSTAVARTVRGADAVVSTLGGYRGPESIAVGTRNIVTAMRRTGSSRLVVLQGFHVHFPGDASNPGKWLVKAFLGLRCRGLLTYGAQLGELLRATDDLTWTLVRIPRMVEGGASDRARTGTFALGPWSAVRVGDVASELLTLAQSEASLHEAPMLYTPRVRQPAPGAITTDSIHR